MGGASDGGPSGKRTNGGGARQPGAGRDPHRDHLFRCTSSTICTTQVTNIVLSKSTDGLRATINPYGASSTLLAANTRYKAVVTTGVRDLAGNALDQDSTTAGDQQKSWTFTTKG
jgi:hypothetical protein